MAEKELRKEIEKWMDDPPEELADAFLEFQDIDNKDKVISFTIGEDEHAFTISYPEKYPKPSEVLLFPFLSKF